MANLCGCGCGAEVRGKWVRGHHSRVNNISKRPDIREKRREMFERLHEEGKLGDPWNKGLTSTDPRVIANLQGSWKFLRSEEGRRISSLRLKKEWQEGAITPLSGADHPRWKGGVSSIVQRLRGSGLYREWKLPILRRDNFRCIRCGLERDLHVHHDKERFAEIVQRFLPDDRRQLTWDEETEVISQIVGYHVGKNVSGVTLCVGCHTIAHQHHDFLGVPTGRGLVG